MFAWAYRMWRQQPDPFACPVCGSTSFLRRNAANTAYLDLQNSTEVEPYGGVLTCRRGHNVGTWRAVH